MMARPVRSGAGGREPEKGLVHLPPRTTAAAPAHEAGALTFLKGRRPRLWTG